MRRRDWVERLFCVVQDAETRRFHWGEHDCCTFAARCIDAVTGATWEADLRECYQDEAGALAYIEDEGGISASVSGRFGEPVPMALCRRGDIALIDSPIGHAIAVCLGTTLVAPGPVGLTVLPISAGTHAWRID